VLPDIGVQYPHNWCSFQGRLLLMPAPGVLLLMNEDGGFDTTFANPVTHILRTFSLASTAVGYNPSNDSIVVMNGDVYTLDSFYNQDTVTTTNTPNTWMSATTGLTRRSTSSSLRYKENVVDIRTVPALDPNKLLSLPVRAFTYKADYLDSADDRSNAPLPGFIAEEVATAYEIAADKNDGVIESWNDRFVVPGMLALIQDLHARVSTLEGGTQ